MEKNKSKASDKRMTHTENIVEKALANRFEGTWRSGGIVSKYSYYPEICQKLKNYVLDWVKKSETKNEAGFRTIVDFPPQLSEFARTIGVPTRVINDWAMVFPDLQEEIETLNDLNREMLINGGLSERYSAKITTVMLDYAHDIREKKESLLPAGTALIPMSAVQSIQFLIQQQGLPPVKLTDFEEVK